MSSAAWTIWLLPISGIFAIPGLIYLYLSVTREETGPREMQEVARAIREGAMAFLRRQYTTIFLIAVIVAILLGFTANGLYTSVAFFVGALCSGIAGFTGMYTSVSSNLRTAAAARHSVAKALLLSFRGGAVNGLAVVALALLGITALFYAYGGASDPQRATLLIAGFGFGASFVALFAQLGGGIYTKAADVGADLVGKVEAGIPEDDPRNPAVVADLVGDNVGDCAGRGADLFESTAAENIGAMILGISLFSVLGLHSILFPLIAGAAGLIGSTIGILAVRMREQEEPMQALNRGYYLTVFINLVLLYFVVTQMLSAPGVKSLYFYFAAVIGLAVSFLFVWITQYYTSGSYRPVQE
ncbi:MAG: sodium/proton-translocating pyrophosphatase, partial [Clostridia bacterium]|nr:sodium/proton-translocating pyrophosphatase [Clostridia bacterium]